MLTAKEWFKKELSGEPLTQESVIEVIKMIQQEVIEETIKLCVENVGFLYNGTTIPEINKKKILNCAEILKKEL